MVRRNKKKEFKINIPKLSVEEFKDKIKSADWNVAFVFAAIFLVLGMGLWALFSDEAQNARKANPACGKIVVAAEGPDLKANVSPTLSSARYFLVINPLSNKMLESAKNPYWGKPNTNLDVAYFVVGKGEEAVIAGRINQQSSQVFSQFGVKVYGGYKGQVRDVVDLYRQARISQGTNGQYVQAAPPGMTQAGFGIGRDAADQGLQPINFFLCPTCQWRVAVAAGTPGFPRCPNCQTIMSGTRKSQAVQQAAWKPLEVGQDMARSGMKKMNPTVENNNTQTTQSIFTCPVCGWATANVQNAGEFPRCANCRSVMTFGGNAYQYFRYMNNFQTQSNAGAQVAFGGGACVIK